MPFLLTTNIVDHKGLSECGIKSALYFVGSISCSLNQSYAFLIINPRILSFGRSGCFGISLKAQYSSLCLLKYFSNSFVLFGKNGFPKNKIPIKRRTTFLFFFF